ncbi:MAG: MerR family transcriptional regulator [Myxococcota bacterium]|nr:MerR family transcriptional regulator [Myxococcota bacterium]
MPHKIGELARLAGVSVRTLRHYDDIGLLPPSARSEAGYRQYDDESLMRLQAVLFWRSLGFPLEEIGALLDASEDAPLEALQEHRRRLTEQSAALQSRITALDRVIQQRLSGLPSTSEDMLTIFEGFDPSAFEAEAEQRWGDTEPWKQAAARTKRYGPSEWKEIKAQQEALEAELAELLVQGLPPTHPRAIALAEQHRLHTERWFYDCPAEIHRGLAEMYVQDPRFAEHYDERQPGLAAYLRDAIVALHGPRGKTL